MFFIHSRKIHFLFIAGPYFKFSAVTTSTHILCTQGLTDVDYVSFEKANETRQNNLQSATVSLQVVIGLCKRKETAALKIKAAVSNGRVNLSALRRLFSFAVVRQNGLLFLNGVRFFLCELTIFNCIRNSFI